MSAARSISLASFIVWLALGAGCTPSEPSMADAGAGRDAAGEDAGEEDAGEEPPTADGGNDAGGDAPMRGPGASCAVDDDCLEDPGASNWAGSACVEGGCGCRSNSDCGLAGTLGLICSATLRSCVPCEVDDDCVTTGWGAVCVDLQCEDCVTSSDCTSPDAPVCDDAHTCVECLDSSHCAANPNGRVCFDGLCGCTSHGDCPDGTVCDFGTCF